MYVFIAQNVFVAKIMHFCVPFSLSTEWCTVCIIFCESAWAIEVTVRKGDGVLFLQSPADTVYTSPVLLNSTPIYYRTCPVI